MTEEQPISFKLKFHDTKTHIKALFSGEELGHGTKRNSIRSVLLQRRGSLAHQQARRHQTGGHFSQFELKILQTGEKLTVRPVVKSAFISLKRGKKTVPLTWLLESVSPNCLRTNRWSLDSCTQACAAPREQDAEGRVKDHNQLRGDHLSSGQLKHSFVK